MKASLKHFLLECLVGIIVLSLIGGMLAELTYILNYPTNTLEYQAGYQAGYTENNETKYQAACNLTNTLIVECTTEQYRYALGYEYGHIQKQNEIERANKQIQTNNSIKILGI